MTSRQHPNDFRGRHVLVNRNCIALVLQRTRTEDRLDQRIVLDGHAVFVDFLLQNSTCFWNSCLMRSVASLEYRGCLMPATLLISGTNFALEVVRSAWARRVLRPPKGYTISKLGDVGTVDMLPMLQTQFAPLSEALCKAVADLNGDGLTATTDSIRTALEEGFPEMQVPCEDILHRTLGGLIRERKVYHTGNGYFIVSPDTYWQRAASPVCERQMLMTNEEAIVRLHSGQNRRECSLAIQVDEMDIAAAWKSCSSTSSFLQQAKTTTTQSTQVQPPPPPSPDLQLLERNHSLRVLRAKGRPKSGTVDRVEEPKVGCRLDDLDSIHKSEKQSMLARILKRMQFLTDKSTKHVVFSAQFPPLEWLEGDDGTMRCHSVATQTQLLPQQQKVGSKPVVMCLEPPRTPRQEAPNNWDRREHLHYVAPIVNKNFHSEPDGSSLRKNPSFPTRQRYSPSHRYSHHGTFAIYSKRRHRHRRSSSESPKMQKILLTNGCPSQSTSSNGEDKAYRSSSGGSAATKEPKESDWARVKSCYSKDEARSPPGYLDREVLKDVKNISTTKIDNVSRKAHDQKVNTLKEEEKKPPPTATDQTRLDDSSSIEKSVSCNGSGEAIKPETLVRPLVLKSFVDIPTLKPAKILPPGEILVDNSVSVEVALPSSPKSKATTVVTEETTVTKTNGGHSKVVTVTSVTTSLSPPNGSGLKEDAGKHTPDPGFPESIGDRNKSTFVNDLNVERGEKGARIIDCSSSCNIVTGVK